MVVSEDSPRRDGEQEEKVGEENYEQSVSQLLIRTDRNGSIATRRVKTVDPHAWFEELEL